ncbi:MAG: DUF4384 domain-containing protein [Desulfosarcinaceae bacterium]|nr:DUF4384 domain-containing protein [Desulfosarcinaceae bacterium]
MRRNFILSGAISMGLSRRHCRRIAWVILVAAVILWRIPAALAGETPPATAPGVPIQVEITTHLGDGHRFVHGDTIAFYLSLNQDAHIVAIYEDANRQRIQIVPNANQESSFYPAGWFRPIPTQDAAFRFTVAPPFGRERLWVFASRAPIEAFSGELLANGLKRLHADIPSIIRRIKAQAGDAYGEYCLQLHTSAAP